MLVILCRIILLSSAVVAANAAFIPPTSCPAAPTSIGPYAGVAPDLVVAFAVLLLLLLQHVQNNNCKTLMQNNN